MPRLALQPLGINCLMQTQQIKCESTPLPLLFTITAKQHRQRCAYLLDGLHMRSSMEKRAIRFHAYKRVH